MLPRQSRKRNRENESEGDESSSSEGSRSHDSDDERGATTSKKGRPSHSLTEQARQRIARNGAWNPEQLFPAAGADGIPELTTSRGAAREGEAELKRDSKELSAPLAPYAFTPFAVQTLLTSLDPCAVLSASGHRAVARFVDDFFQGVVREVSRRARQRAETAEVESVRNSSEEELQQVEKTGRLPVSARRVELTVEDFQEVLDEVCGSSNVP
jgi:hypothetical protein